MIEPEDLILPDTATQQSSLLIPEFRALNCATVNSIASKLKGLESMLIIGAFDVDHLQQIHVRIFEDALPRAGNLRQPRPSSLSSSLDSLFDKLARENRLKGLELDAWSQKATEYLHEIERINPFDEGSDIASIEFFRELAAENGLMFRWERAAEFAGDELPAQVQTISSDNLRRLLILAVDPDLSKRKSLPSRDRNNSLDLIPFL